MITTTVVAALSLGLFAVSASAREIRIAAGDDYEAECLMVVQPGDVCYLEAGDYYHDGLTRVDGTPDAPITITGDPDACIKGSNTQDRVFQVAHSHYIIDNICFNGLHDDQRVSKAIYVLGAEYKYPLTVGDTELTTSVTGLKLINLKISDFGEECVHLKYFTTWTEIMGCTIQNCGYEDFHNGGSGVVGEAVYVGTSLDQVGDGKAPEVQLRTGDADEFEVDVCSHNWIHDNVFHTYGNECVDVKEGSEYNLIENNVCTHQLDVKSGGFGLRGSFNTVRYNDIEDCEGAAVRMGGGDGYGTGNNIYENTITNVGNGAFNVMMDGQGVVCGNIISGAEPAVGDFKDDAQFELAASTGACSSRPGDLDGAPTSPGPTPSDQPSTQSPTSGGGASTSSDSASSSSEGSTPPTSDQSPTPSTSEQESTPSPSDQSPTPSTSEQESTPSTSSSKPSTYEQESIPSTSGTSSTSEQEESTSDVGGEMFYGQDDDDDDHDDGANGERGGYHRDDYYD